MEVSSGSTKVMVLRKGNMVAAHTLAIGSLRLQEEVAVTAPPGNHVRGYVEERVKNAIAQIAQEASLADISLFIGVGGDIRI